MSDFVKNEEMIKSLEKEEIFNMWETATLNNKKLNDNIRYLKDLLRSETKEKEKFIRLYHSNKRDEQQCKK